MWNLILYCVWYYIVNKQLLDNKLNRDWLNKKLLDNCSDETINTNKQTNKGSYNKEILVNKN